MMDSAVGGARPSSFFSCPLLPEETAMNATTAKNDRIDPLSVGREPDLVNGLFREAGFRPDDTTRAVAAVPRTTEAAARFSWDGPLPRSPGLRGHHGPR